MISRRSTFARCASLAGAIALVASATGCFTTTVKSGAPAAPPVIEYDEKWHSGLIVGIAELSGPYDLSKICPNGWAEIKTETSFLNGLVQAVTWGIYNPQTVTVRCAGGPAAPGTSLPPGVPPAPMGPPPPPGTMPPSPPPSAPAPSNPPPAK
jgi:hypothetical protein